MNTFDYITLLAFVNENRDFITGSRVAKIQQPTKRDLLLTLKNHNLSKKLYININPQIYHTCFVSDESLDRRNIVIPASPPMFCMLLRKYIDRCKIIRVNVPYYERILELYIETYDEINQKISICLSVEFMGKHSNIILYNNDTKKIIGCAHNVGAEKSQYRELFGTLQYIYPPKQEKLNILNYYGAVNYEELNRTFLGISIQFQDLLKSKSVSLEQIKNYLQLKAEIQPKINRNNFCIYSELLDGGIIQRSVNEMIDNYFSVLQENINIKTLRMKLLNITNPLLRKTLNKIKSIDNELKKEDKSVKYKKYAELILSNMYNYNDYTELIKVTDWENSCETEIKLNKDFTLKENANKYYELYKKAKNKREILNKLKDKIIIDKINYEQIIYSINTADSIKLLQDIESECKSKEYPNVTNNNSKQQITKIKSSDYTIYIGKNNKQNDYIISKISSANDYWFHIKNAAGSHILLKMINNIIPNDKLIYKCCKLAKEYSSAKLNKKSEVIYTLRKHIKKPPKTPLGYVTYKNETEIIVSD